jgi:lipopolysaccharide export system protein LptA
VHGRELPTRTETGKTLDKEMECERLELLKRANGTLSDIHASGKVLARQTELRTNSANAVVTTLSSDKLDAKFLEITNQIDMATAEGHVVLTRDDTVATGDRAVYRALDDKAVLTGNPKVDARQGWLIAKESIVYDHKTGETRAMGGFELHSKPGAFSKTNAPAEKASRDLPP